MRLGSPDINKDELISKVRDCIKDIGYDQEGFTYKKGSNKDWKAIYTLNQQILRWVLILQETKTKAQEIKG